MTYGHRRAPFGNQARISDDSGQNWSEAMILLGDASSGDLGYPSTEELDDGAPGEPRMPCASRIRYISAVASYAS